jgi:GGDEF domain-containing protein
VLRHADQAMYYAKRDGGRIHLYDGHEAAPFEDTWLESRR